MSNDTQALDNRRTLTKLSIVAALMFGFGFALVPFYEKICQALGVNSLVERSDAPVNTQVDLARTVTIELDANSHNLPWRFRALTPHIDVHPGQLVHVEYEVANVRGAPVTGQAVVSCASSNASATRRKRSRPGRRGACRSLSSSTRSCRRTCTPSRCRTRSSKSPECRARARWSLP